MNLKQGYFILSLLAFSLHCPFSVKCKKRPPSNIKDYIKYVVHVPSTGGIICGFGISPPPPHIPMPQLSEAGGFAYPTYYKQGLSLD
jgi:hypothetical protein